ncbi:MAG: hypothetical protein N2170_05320 [Bacteroidia bacterium]|nr:hypothetical protein [Bacteroidia bacterium]
MQFRGGVQHKDIARGALWNAIGYLLGGALALALPIFLLKWLGRAQYGIVSYLTLLVSQSYLFNLGMGEVMAQRLTAATSLGRFWEGWRCVRASLSVVWGSSILLTIGWLYAGPSLVGHLLRLSKEEVDLLHRVYYWVPPAIWGVQTGLWGSWIPIALRRFRWAALNTITLALWQGVFPLAVLSLSPIKSAEIALRSLLLGYSLYGLTAWLGILYFLKRLPWPGHFREGFSLLKTGLWPAAGNMLGIPANFIERTLIAQWGSLHLMGFYSALHYFFSKGNSIVLKALEALFPVFGSQADPPRRQFFRLSQAVWLFTFFGGLTGFVGWGVGIYLLQRFPIQVGEMERRTIAGVVGAWMALLPIGPYLTFYTSRGHLRAAFWINLLIVTIQSLLAAFWVKKGFFFWATIGSSTGGMLLGGALMQERGNRGLWWSWVGPTYLWMLFLWAISTFTYLYWPHSDAPLLVIFLSGFLFVGGELIGKMGKRKRIFLKNLIESVGQLANAAGGRLLRPLRERALDDG